MGRFIKILLIFCLTASVSPRVGVAEGDFLSPEDKNIGIEVTVDKTTVSVNEKIKLNYNLYTRYDIRYEGFQTEGRFRGFWIDTAPLPTSIPREVAVVKGKRYVKACVKEMFLSPIYGGDLIIHPGVAKLNIAKESFMARAFSGFRSHKTGNTLLDLKPVVIHVNDPTGRSKEEFLSEFSDQHGIKIPAAHVKADEPALVILLDISRSMLAEDMQPQNRLVSAKAALSKFLQANTEAMIGLKCFAKHVTTVSPLAQSQSEAVKALEGIQPALAEEDGTSMGDAVFEAVKELAGYGGNKKEVILITDGMNNSGHLDPFTAIDLATHHHVTVHAIALGKKGLVPYPDPKNKDHKTMVEVGTDERTLAEMAKETKGKFGVAESGVELGKMLNEIQKTLEA